MFSHQKPSNGGFADSKVASSGAITPNRSSLVAVAESRIRIGKRMYWSPVGSADGVWKDDGPGEWHKPSDIGFPKKDDSLVGKNYRWHIFDIRSTEQRAALRRELAQNTNMALVWGVPTEAYLEKFTQESEHHRVANYGAFRRLDSVFVDAPRDYLMLDIDNLDLGIFDDSLDVIRDHDRLGHILMDVLGAIGLDWLLADCIIHLSSTHGLSGRQRFKAHVEWKLSTPLTIAQQKCVATYVNEQATKAGYGKICDDTICDPARILFTSPPQTLKRVWRDGKGIINEPVPAPVTDRVQHLRYGDPVIDVPECALALHISEQRAQKVRKLTHIGHHPDAAALGRKAAGKPGKNKLEPGNVYNYVRGEIFKAAKTAPAHRVEEVLARLQQRLEAAILSLGSEDAAQLDKRLSYCRPDEVRRSFMAAYEKRYAWRRYTEAPATEPQYSVAGVRNAVKREVVQCANAAFAVRREGVGQTDEGQLTTARPTHTLLRVPPGVGKTHAALAAIEYRHLTFHRTSFLGATTRQSEEAAQRRIANMAPGDSFGPTLVRHHKGRQLSCKNKEYGALAELIESTGRSPLRSVCARCPLREECAWFKQQNDKGSGLIVGQHAHATTAYAKMTSETEGAPDFIIVDESMMSSLLPEKARRSLNGLRDAVSGTEIRNAKGSVLIGQTNDARGYRSKALSALERSKGVIYCESLGHFLASVRVRARNCENQLRSVTRIVDAIDTEHEVARSAYRMIDLEMKAYEAAATEKAKRESEARIGRFATLLKDSNWFLSLFRAIKSSLSIPGREHVLGVRVDQSNVSLQLRSELPEIFKQRDVLWMDGTACPDIWRSLLGHANVDARVVSLAVQPGSYHLTQFADRPYGRTMFCGKDGDSRGPIWRSDSNLQRMKRFILWAESLHGKVVVMAQLGVKAALLEALGGMVVRKGTRIDVKATKWIHGNIHFEHYNAIRGLDRYKDFPAAVVIGRPMPRPADLTKMAEGLYYDDPSVVSLGEDSLPEKGTQILSLADGRGCEVGRETCRNTIVDRLKCQIADAEVRQAVNRLRLFDRDASRTAHIYGFGQADTGLPAHKVLDWQDAERTGEEIMAASGVVFLDPGSAKTAFPDLYAGLADRTVRWQIATAGTNRNSAIALRENFSIGVLPSSSGDAWRAVEYRSFEGPRTGPIPRALVDVARHKDPGSVLAQYLDAPVKWRFAGGEWQDGGKASSTPAPPPRAGHSSAQAPIRVIT